MYMHACFLKIVARTSGEPSRPSQQHECWGAGVGGSKALGAVGRSSCTTVPTWPRIILPPNSVASLVFLLLCPGLVSTSSQPRSCYSSGVSKASTRSPFCIGSTREGGSERGAELDSCFITDHSIDVALRDASSSSGIQRAVKGSDELTFVWCAGSLSNA